MGAKEAVKIVFRGQDNQDKLKDEYLQKFSNPFPAANRGYTDDIIEPSLTRKYLCKSLEMLQTKELMNPMKKHANIPL